jgi:hypothetical protein
MVSEMVRKRRKQKRKRNSEDRRKVLSVPTMERIHKILIYAREELIEDWYR